MSRYRSSSLGRIRGMMRREADREKKRDADVSPLVSETLFFGRDDCKKKEFFLPHLNLPARSHQYLGVCILESECCTKIPPEQAGR